MARFVGPRAALWVCFFASFSFPLALCVYVVCILFSPPPAVFNGSSCFFRGRLRRKQRTRLQLVCCVHRHLSCLDAAWTITGVGDGLSTLRLACVHDASREWPPILRCNTAGYGALRARSTPLRSLDFLCHFVSSRCNAAPACALCRRRTWRDLGPLVDAAPLGSVACTSSATTTVRVWRPSFLYLDRMRPSLWALTCEHLAACRGEAYLLDSVEGAHVDLVSPLCVPTSAASNRATAVNDGRAHPPRTAQPAADDGQSRGRGGRTQRGGGRDWGGGQRALDARNILVHRRRRCHRHRRCHRCRRCHSRRRCLRLRQPPTAAVAAATFAAGRGGCGSHGAPVGSVARVPRCRHSGAVAAVAVAHEGGGGRRGGDGR